ncbi:hypothetical protein HMPREF0063_12087 [Aeromicrobium marinum DSM 15272]|uniref:Thioesterase family protein n=1 Tax=Aeromicrobium marinum DSM 15272 TaxID=585531 RepID=E2SCC5_9ACTN|nr:thioesterase family protein [Aeromicrobium marinum]EFQ82878.1 hypothetical protein HMPREF0063_12087 [Aeromicrobium marinum DSM 15272]
MAYFSRIDDRTFQPSLWTGGAWNLREQHIAPALGLLTHLVEHDRIGRADDFVIGRLSYDILGPLPIEPFEADVHLVRAGRTVELTEASLSHHQRPVVRLRAWLLKPHDTQSLAGTPLPRIAPPLDMQPWDATSVWRGEFIKTISVRRAEEAPGRAAYWLRTDEALLDDEPVSPLARAAGLFDVANGMAARVSPTEATYPNVDLTVHLFGTPRSDWLGFDTSASFGSNGLGLTSTVLHDESEGPIGVIGQALTVRPVARGGVERTIESPS